jgi:hypothetical protein
MLKRPDPSYSRASTVAAAASFRWMNEVTPPPSPTIGKLPLAHRLDQPVIGRSGEAAAAERSRRPS